MSQGESILLAAVTCAPILYFMWWWCGNSGIKGTRLYNKYKKEQEEFRKKFKIDE